MAGLFGFEAPALTDFAGAAEATAAGNALANQQATAANRPNQSTPWGTSTWTQDANGNWTQNIGLGGNQQQTLGAQQGIDYTLANRGNALAGQVAGGMGQPLNTSGMTGMFGLGAPSTIAGAQFQNYAGPTAAQQQQLSTANASWSATPQIQQAMLAQMQPQMNQQRNAEIARLKAQGLTEGSEAWNNAINNLGTQQNNLNMQALIAGNNAANQQFQNQLGLDTANNQFRQTNFGNQFNVGQANNQLQQNMFNNALQSNAQNWGQQTDKANITGQQRNQQLSEALALRQLPYQELMQLRGQNVAMPEMPGFSTAGAISGPNYLGAAELTTRQAQNAANAQNAQNAQNWGGLLDLGKLGYDIYSNW